MLFAAGGAWLLWIALTSTVASVTIGDRLCVASFGIAVAIAGAFAARASLRDATGFGTSMDAIVVQYRRGQVAVQFKDVTAVSFGISTFFHTDIILECGAEKKVKLGIMHKENAQRIEGAYQAWKERTRNSVT